MEKKGHGMGQECDVTNGWMGTLAVGNWSSFCHHWISKSQHFLADEMRWAEMSVILEHTTTTFIFLFYPSLTQCHQKQPPLRVYGEITRNNPADIRRRTSRRVAGRGRRRRRKFHNANLLRIISFPHPRFRDHAQQNHDQSKAIAAFQETWFPIAH